MNKKIKILIGCIAGGLVAAAIAVVFIVIPLAQQGAVNARYEEAMRLIDASKYEDSNYKYRQGLDILIELNSDGFDIQDEITEHRYYLANENFKAGYYTSAIADLELIQDYKDSYALLQECWYLAGIKALYSGNIKAYEYFEQPILKGYKDSAQFAYEAREFNFMYWNSYDEYYERLEEYRKLLENFQK